MTVTAMIIIAVGDEVVIAHPRGHTDLATVLLLYPGPVLYLGFQAWQSRRAKALVLASRLITVVALVALAGLGIRVPPFLAAIGATLPLVQVAVVDGRSRTIDHRHTSRNVTEAA